MNNDTSWFEKHPALTMTAVMLILLLIVELVMHGMYWLNILPKNVIYMTLPEKADYRTNINNIVYEDFVPRRANGYSTYTQQGIPPQYIKFDNNGMREDSYSSSSKNDVVIGVFGDSYTDALQVGQLEAYPALLENKLRDSNCNVDVRNYGLGATGTSVQYLRYKQRKQQGEKFDYVILTLFQNDIINNSQILDQLFAKSYEHYPYFILNNGELVRSDWHAQKSKQTWKGIKNFLHNYSHLANTFFNLKQIYTSWKNTQISTQANDKTIRIGKKTEMDNLYNAPIDEKWRNAWDVTEAIIKQWQVDATRDKEKFILVILTESVQLDTTKPNTTNLDYEYPNNRLMAFARKNGITAIDFLPHARNYVDTNKLSFPFISWEQDGHYSQIGHNLLSKVIYEQINIQNCTPTNKL